MDRTEPSHAPAAVVAFGELLRQHRFAAGLTQESLAERTGLSVNRIQQLERGGTHPYRGTVQRLARALALAPEEHVQFWAAGRSDPRPSALRSRRATRRQPTYQHNLPASLSSFIGREHELAEVQARL